MGKYYRKPQAKPKPRAPRKTVVKRKDKVVASKGVVVYKPKKVIQRSMAVRLNKLENAVGRKIYENLLYSYGQTNTNTMPNVSIFPLSNVASYVRLFSPYSTDSAVQKNALIKKMEINVKTGPRLGTGAVATDTPINAVVHIRFFLVSLKWALRLEQSTTHITNLLAADMIKGVHYDYNISAPDAYWNPLLSTKFFNILAYKDYKYIPNMFYLNASNVATQMPADQYANSESGEKNFKFHLRPKNFYVNGKDRSWQEVSNDDIPYNHQYYIVALADTNDTQSTTSIPFRIAVSEYVTISQLSSR